MTETKSPVMTYVGTWPEQQLKAEHYKFLEVIITDLVYFKR